MKTQTSSYPSIVILTGAGISAESGVKTFRDHNGLWENHRIEDVASIDGFYRNPKLVQSFYNARRLQLQDPNIAPNGAHVALAELEEKWPGEFLLITQNVDNLHERAGSKKLIHMHGELAKIRCQKSSQIFETFHPIDEQTQCICCRKVGTLRPHIVWFGEMPMMMDEIFTALERCDLFIAIGTSGQVCPAAGFVHQVEQSNPHAKRIEINPEASAVASAFTELRKGLATREVPSFVKEVLESIMVGK